MCDCPVGADMATATDEDDDATAAAPMLCVAVASAVYTCAPCSAHAGQRTDVAASVATAPAPTEETSTFRPRSSHFRTCFPSLLVCTGTGRWTCSGSLSSEGILIEEVVIPSTYFFILNLKILNSISKKYASM